MENGVADDGEEGIQTYKKAALAAYTRILSKGGKYTFWTELGPVIKQAYKDSNP